MNKYLITFRFLTFVGFLVLISCSGNGKKAQNDSLLQEASLIEVSIGGMTCLGCEQTIQNNISKLEGIKSVKASFTVGKAIVEFFPEKIDTIKIKEAVTGSGYTVKKFSNVQPEESSK